eukprot:scaffold4305_cov123-Skeletonema_menzelii.AAC.4
MALVTSLRRRQVLCSVGLAVAIMVGVLEEGREKKRKMRHREKRRRVKTSKESMMQYVRHPPCFAYTYILVLQSDKRRTKYVHYINHKNL